jgi:hypothetical protein
MNHKRCQLITLTNFQLGSDVSQSAISAGGSAASTASQEAATAVGTSSRGSASQSASGTSSGDSGSYQTAAPFMLGAAGLAFAALL